MKEKPILFNKEKYPDNILHIIEPDIKLPLNAAQAKGFDKAIQTLTKREKEVLHCRAEEQLTLDATSKKLGITRERVRQIQFKLLWKLSSKPLVDWIIYGGDSNKLLTKDSFIEELLLPRRVCQCLRRARLRTIEDVCVFFKDHTYDNIRNMGKKTYLILCEKMYEKTKINLKEVANES